MRHFSKTFTLGVAGYHYEQITGDSGAGATLGDFEGRVTALGPVMTYSFALGKIPVSTRWTYFHEFDVQNRIEGNVGLVYSFNATVSGEILSTRCNSCTLR